jgi:hypothetical protein
MWSCPHCGTPQPEADRCWVCRRSSVCCATCRHVRRAVTADLAYCGMDRLRTPLTGHEVRPCWQAAPTSPDANDRSNRPVGAGLIPVILDPAAVDRTISPAADRWTLFDDLDA